MTLSDTFYSARNNSYVEHSAKKVALMLMKRGIDRKEVKPPAIYDRLVEIFGKNHPEMPATPDRQNAIRIIRRWIDDVEYEGLDVPYDPAEVGVELRSYVARLAVLKSAMFKGEKLTAGEVEQAKRTLIEFQDPHGETVDLLAQYAVLWELAEREAKGSLTSDIEDLFTYAPWVSNEASQLYRVAKETGLIEDFAWLRLIAVLVAPDPSGSYPEAKIPEMITGIHAHLNLPYVWSYTRKSIDDGWFLGVTYRDDPALLAGVTEPTDAEHCKRYANWHRYLQLIQSGAETETITLPIGRDGQEQSDD